MNDKPILLEDGRELVSDVSPVCIVSRAQLLFILCSIKTERVAIGIAQTFDDRMGVMLVPGDNYSTVHLVEGKKVMVKKKGHR